MYEVYARLVGFFRSLSLSTSCSIHQLIGDMQCDSSSICSAGELTWVPSMKLMWFRPREKTNVRAKGQVYQ